MSTQPVESKRPVRWPWVVAGGVLVGIIGIGLALVLLISTLFSALGAALDFEFDLGLNLEGLADIELQENHAITREQFDLIQVGATREQVVATLGKEPADPDLLLSAEVIADHDLRADCIYFVEFPHVHSGAYRFCFEGDVLASKRTLEWSST